MSLRLRLTLTYLLVTISGLLLLGGGFIALAGRYTAQQRARTLAGQAEVFANFVTELVRTPTALQSLAPDLAASGVVPGDVTVRIFSPAGTLLSAQRGLGPFPSRAVLDLVENPLPLPISQVSDRRYVAFPMMRDGALLGVVELSHPTAEEAQLQRALRAMVGQAALLAALVMTLVSLLVARSIARPITQLTHHAGELASGSPAHSPPTAPIVEMYPDQTRRSRSNDEIHRLAHSLEDMAGQLQARIAEAERERTRLAAVLTTISEGVVALDAAGELLFANPAAAALLESASPAEIAPRLAALDLLPPDDLPVEHEVTIGSRQLLITISPVSAATQATAVQAMPPQVLASVWVLRDMTRLKALEQARTRFFRSISHDLRTPLTTIRGMLENMQDVAPPAQQATLTTIEDETARLARLVEELLHPPDNGMLLPTERRPINLDVLAREICDLQQGRARRAGITLTCTVLDSPPPVYGDRDRLKQALLNLLDNALRFTPAGGTVVIEVTTAQPSSSTSASAIRLSVADNGPGIPAELRERIWERGVRGVDLGYPDMDGEQRGAGLGLAIVREIVTAHGGQVRVDAHAPRGARFVLELPSQRLP
jgi:signal transduction histidine kinase/HAMP domain-containing protein